MSSRDTYQPGSAFGAEIHKTDDKHWTLIVTRELRHPPAQVWEALTDPAELREWAPFDVDRNLGATGPARGSPQAPPSIPHGRAAQRPSRLLPLL